MNLVQGRRLHSGNLQCSVLSHCKLRLQSEAVADTSFKNGYELIMPQHY